ncbi:MAG: methylamine utilization MauE [Vicinamibacteria bacterium]|nr:methylamine utilization MauE [Vicinamibacteria bacterium]
MSAALAFLRREPVHRVLSLVLGVVFVFASHDKILDPVAFARIVYYYRLLGPNAEIPPLVANVWAVTLPWIELVAGGLLMLGVARDVWRREAALVCGALLVIFVGAVSYALALGINLQNCGCFSVDGAGRGAGLALIVGDLALLAVAAVLVFLPPAQGRGGDQSPS